MCTYLLIDIFTMWGIFRAGRRNHVLALGQVGRKPPIDRADGAEMFGSLCLPSWLPTQNGRQAGPSQLLLGLLPPVLWGSDDKAEEAGRTEGAISQSSGPSR